MANQSSFESGSAYKTGDVLIATYRNVHFMPGDIGIVLESYQFKGNSLTEIVVICHAKTGKIAHLRADTWKHFKGNY